jgi:hypothetical protein
MANLMKTTPTTIMNHPPHSSDLAHSDFNLFGPTKVHPGGQKFQTYDELKRGALNLVRNQNKTSMLLASVTCQDNGKIY